MSISITINPKEYKIQVQTQKAALEISSRFKRKEKNRLNEIFDELISICDAKIAFELEVLDAINL